MTIEPVRPVPPRIRKCILFEPEDLLEIDDVFMVPWEVDKPEVGCYE